MSLIAICEYLFIICDSLSFLLGVLEKLNDREQRFEIRNGFVILHRLTLDP